MKSSSAPASTLASEQVRVKKVPLVTRPNANANLGSNFHQSFGRQNLDGLTDYVSAYVQTTTKFCLSVQSIFDTRCIATQNLESYMPRAMGPVD